MIIVKINSGLKTVSLPEGSVERIEQLGDEIRRCIDNVLAGNVCTRQLTETEVCICRHMLSATLGNHEGITFPGFADKFTLRGPEVLAGFKKEFRRFGRMLTESSKSDVEVASIEVPGSGTSGPFAERAYYFDSKISFPGGENFVEPLREFSEEESKVLLRVLEDVENIFVYDTQVHQLCLFACLNEACSKGECVTTDYFLAKLLTDYGIKSTKFYVRDYCEKHNPDFRESFGVEVVGNDDWSYFQPGLCRPLDEYDLPDEIEGIDDPISELKNRIFDSARHFDSRISQERIKLLLKMIFEASAKGGSISKKEIADQFANSEFKLEWSTVKSMLNSILTTIGKTPELFGYAIIGGPNRFRATLLEEYKKSDLDYNSRYLGMASVEPVPKDFYFDKARYDKLLPQIKNTFFDQSPFYKPFFEIVSRYSENGQGISIPVLVHLFEKELGIVYPEWQIRNFVALTIRKAFNEHVESWGLIFKLEDNVIYFETSQEEEVEEEEVDMDRRVADSMRHLSFRKLKQPLVTSFIMKLILEHYKNSTIFDKRSLWKQAVAAGVDCKYDFVSETVNRVRLANDEVPDLLGFNIVPSGRKLMVVPSDEYERYELDYNCRYSGKISLEPIQKNLNFALSDYMVAIDEYLCCSIQKSQYLGIALNIFASHAENGCGLSYPVFKSELEKRGFFLSPSELEGLFFTTIPRACCPPSGLKKYLKMVIDRDHVAYISTVTEAPKREQADDFDDEDDKAVLAGRTLPRAEYKTPVIDTIRDPKKELQVIPVQNEFDKKVFHKGMEGRAWEVLRSANGMHMRIVEILCAYSERHEAISAQALTARLIGDGFFRARNEYIIKIMDDFDVFFPTYSNNDTGISLLQTEKSDSIYYCLDTKDYSNYEFFGEGISSFTRPPLYLENDQWYFYAFREFLEEDQPEEKSPDHELSNDQGLKPKSDRYAHLVGNPFKLIDPNSPGYKQWAKAFVPEKKHSLPPDFVLVALEGDLSRIAVISRERIAEMNL